MRINAYHEELLKWEKENPLPFDVQDESCYDYTPVFVCAPNKKIYWDEVELPKLLNDAEINPLVESQFMEFLKEHFADAEPKWWLVPFYG
jgi:hypothetical protein